MSRKTITITAPNGAKVRTVHSKRYYVVSFREVDREWSKKLGDYVRHETPKPVAHVERRTDSVESAFAQLRKSSSDQAVYGVSADGELITRLSWSEVSDRARTEKGRKKFQTRVIGRQGQARSLWY